MEVNQPRQRTNWRLCQTHNCSANASTTCLTDEAVVCDMCTAVFHYDCDVNIKDGEGFIYHALETLNSLVEIMKDRGMRTRIDKIKKDFIEEIAHIHNEIKALESEIAGKQILSSNVDYFVKKTRKLVKRTMESHIYSSYTDYVAKLKICEIVPNKLDEDGEMGLHNLRTQFYLDVKRKEMDFRENKLKAIVQELNARLNQAKQQSDQKFAAVDGRLSQQADYSKSSIEQLEQRMLSMFKDMEVKLKSNVDEVNKRVDIQEKKYLKSQQLHEELKSNLDEHKKKIDKIEMKQEKMKKDINATNINIEKSECKQNEKADEFNQKINDLHEKSNKLIKKIKLTIEDISKNIESSNKDLKRNLKLKIEKVESKLQKDFNKKQKDIEEDFILVAEILDNDIQKIKIEKENYRKILEQLSLKDDQFYIDKLKLDSDQAKNFRFWFTINLKTYKRLGQFSYGQHRCTTDQIHTCIKGANENNYEWIYMGEVKEGTDDIPHGIGIKVFNDGYIFEGYWKDGKQHGKERLIYDSGVCYIGEYKEGERNGQGTRYYATGDKWYEGGWENDKYYGQGTYYRDGDKYTGQWDDLKGQGEVSYTDGTKYTGHWDVDINDGYKLKRHGLGTLYSVDGQVLNQGKWENNEYKGKE